MRTAYRIDALDTLQKICERAKVPVPEVTFPAFAVLDSSPPVIIEAPAFLALYEAVPGGLNPGVYRERAVERASSRRGLPSEAPRGRTQAVHPESDDPRPPEGVT